MGNKLAKKLRKEIRRYAADKVADVNPKECVNAFIDEAMQLPLRKRAMFAMGLIAKRKGMFPIK